MKRILLTGICMSMLLYSQLSLGAYSKPPVNDFPNHLTSSGDSTVRIDSIALFSIAASKREVYKEEKKATAGLSLGSHGFGVETHIPVSPAWRLLAGATFLPVEFAYNYTGFPSRGVLANLDVSMAKLYFVAEWEPFSMSQRSGLRKLAFSGGGAYFLAAKAKSLMELKDPYYYGDLEISQEDVGQLNVSSNWRGLAPYAGLAYNRVRISNAIGMDIKAGLFYLSSPSVRILGTNMLSDNSQNTGQLKKNLDNFRLMPLLQFNFNYILPSN